MPWVYGMILSPMLGLSLQRFLSVVPFLVLSAPCSVVSSWMLPSSWLLFRSLLWTLFIAHLGCLHLDRSSLRCYYSLLQSSCPIQTILALWIRVLMTLYLAARLWWLSYCKYWSVWVGFLYIEIDKELSSSGFTKVSRKGIALFLWLPSTVNIIAVSKLLMWSRNNCLLASCWMTKVSSTNLNQCLRGWRQYRGPSFQNIPYTIWPLWDRPGIT